MALPTIANPFALDSGVRTDASEADAVVVSLPEEIPDIGVRAPCCLTSLMAAGIRSSSLFLAHVVSPFSRHRHRR